MGNKKITMQKLRQVLRFYSQGKGTKTISSIVGISRNTVKKYLQIFHTLHMDFEDVEKQFATAQKIFDENLSVRETEKLVKKIQNNKDIPVEKKKVSDPVMEAIYHDLEEKMKSILGTKVAINKKDDQKGKIEIEYYSMDELDRIIDLIRTIA